MGDETGYCGTGDTAKEYFVIREVKYVSANMGRLTKQRGCVRQTSFTATDFFLQTSLDLSNKVSKTLLVRVQSHVMTSISLQRATFFLV
jgi:hypothetical protein